MSRWVVCLGNKLTAIHYQGDNKMANPTNKSNEGNLSNDKGMGQTGGMSTKPAREKNTLTENSPSVNAGSSAGDTASKALDTAKDTAKNFVDQAKTAAGDAYGAVADKASSKLQEQKATLAGGLGSVAESVRSMGDNLNQSPNPNPVADYTAQYADTAAQKLEQVANYFEQTDIKAMARDIESFARRNPAVFLGGAFVLGILAARFIKSSPAPSIGGFRTDVDHQIPASTGQGNSPKTNFGTTPGVM